MWRIQRSRLALAVLVALVAVLAGGATGVVQDICGPFTDVSLLYCPYVLEAYYTGITAGTSATTFSPDSPITRGQAAVFVTKGLNQALARSSRRAALGQWWTPQNELALGLTPLTGSPTFLASDGVDVWVSALNGTVSRVRGGDGKLLETWSANGAGSLVVAMGRVFVLGAGGEPPAAGILQMIDPALPAGAAIEVANPLGVDPKGLTFDGGRFWTANLDGSLSIVTPSGSLPWPVTNVDADLSGPSGILFDGASIWVTGLTDGVLQRLDATGAITQTVSVGASPFIGTFDGTNIWILNQTENTLTVVRAVSGQVVATLTGNGLNQPLGAAFDGQRVLVTNGLGGSVSLWNAASLASLGSFPTGSGSQPMAACSDGQQFWIGLFLPHQLARF